MAEYWPMCCFRTCFMVSGALYTHSWSFQLYAFLLSYTICRLRRAPLSSLHLTLVLLVEFGVYVYRDLIPLATYNKRPIDDAEDILFRVKMLALFVAAVVTPLCAPRRYIPVDPKVSFLVLRK
jgi:hypothetical protein